MLRPFYNDPLFHPDRGALSRPRFYDPHMDVNRDMDRAFAMLDHFFDDQRNIMVSGDFRPKFLIFFSLRFVTIQPSCVLTKEGTSLTRWTRPDTAQMS